MIPSHADLTFTVLLFNADTEGNPVEHFSAEVAGQNGFVCVLGGRYIEDHGIKRKYKQLGMLEEYPNFEKIILVLGIYPFLNCVSVLENYVMGIELHGNFIIFE